MDSQLQVKSRMTKHFRSAKRLASALSGHPNLPQKAADDTTFIVPLDATDPSADHTIAARHIPGHWDIPASATAQDVALDIQSFADNGTLASVSAISAERNDWSYHTMSIAFLSAAAALYVFYLILDHPRLLARLFSSPIRRKGRLQIEDKSQRAGSKSTMVRTDGGEFWSGWFLKTGVSGGKPLHITSPVITPGITASTTLDEKRDSAAWSESVSSPYAIPLHLQEEKARSVKHSPSDDTLFSYYGSAESLQDVPTLSYEPALKPRQNQQTLRVITNVDNALAKLQSPKQRCLTGNIRQSKRHESIDSLDTAVSSTELDYNVYTKAESPSRTVASSTMYDADVEGVAASPPPQAYAPPPHVAPLIGYTPYTQKVLLWTPFPRHLPHLTFASVALVGVYLFLVIFSTFFKSSIKFDWMGPDVLRSGLIAMMQIPIILGLGGRGSVFRFLLFGRHANAALRIHKLAGRLCFVCSALHTGLWMRKWISSGELASASASKHIIWGYVAIAALGMITLTSLPWIRRMAYGVFLTCHIAGLVLFLVGLALHIPEAIPYCVAGASLYAADLLIRASRTRIADAHLQVVTGCDSTMVSVAGLRGGWRAGQHVVLRVPKLGGIRGLEGHEFTIASAPSPDGLTLVIKNAGNWSKRLRDISLENEKAGVGLNTTVVVEGPYGGPGNLIFQSFSSVMLVAGGSGISHALGIAHDLIRKASIPPHNVRTRSVKIIWATRTKESVDGLLPTFHKLIECGHKAEQESPYHTILDIQVYVTRQPASLPMRIGSICPVANDACPNVLDISEDPIAVPNQQRLISDIRLISGARPNLNTLLNEMVDSTALLGTAKSNGRLDRDVKPQGIAVAVCGPDPLVVSAREAVRGIAQCKVARVGGIELLEESFIH